ncbi:MAG: 4Fe-4S binding protein [Lachnospiraceae bacterium]|nr:4Fe-4S binding protein [Lachnospiraceae bacterium]
MAYKINDGCVSCGACAGACPAGAISEGPEHYEIDAEACLDCGTCAATCPTGSIEQAE